MMNMVKCNGKDDTCDVVLIINFVAKEYKTFLPLQIYSLECCRGGGEYHLFIFSFVSLTKSPCIHFEISISRGFTFKEDQKIAKF